MKLISSRQITFEEGKITLLKQSIEMIPANYFVGLTRYFMEKQKTDKNALSELYLIGWFVSYVYMNVFEEVYNLKTFVDRYRLGMDVISMSGFGDYKTIDWEKGKLFIHYNGSYHSDNYEGIVWHLKQQNKNLNIVTITTVLQKNIDVLEDENKNTADFIFCVPEDMTRTY